MTLLHSSSLSPSQSLVLKWQALAQMVVAFAREVLRLQKTGARSTAHNAQLLDVWVWSVMFALLAEIEAARSAPDITDADARALEHLQAIASALLALGLYIQSVRRRIRSKWTEPAPSMPGNVCAFARAAPCEAVWSLDSS